MLLLGGVRTEYGVNSSLWLIRICDESRFICDVNIEIALVAMHLLDETVLWILHSMAPLSL